MCPLAEMIVHNMFRLIDPAEQQLMVEYVTHTLPHCTYKFNRAKQWNDYLFRPRYYYTTCSATLQLLSTLSKKEITRHVISIDNSMIASSTERVLVIESIVRSILDSGLYIIGYQQDVQFLMTSTLDVYRASFIELVIEGRPFEQEYVTDLSAFQSWLSKRLPRPTYVK